MMMDCNHRYICKVSDSIIAIIVDACNKIDWVSTRHRRLEQPLRDGKLIEFPFMMSSHKSFTSDETDLLQAAQPIIDIINALYPNHFWVHGEYSCLPPEGVIKFHLDEGWFHGICHRIHIPIITNKNCIMFWEHERFHFPAGEMYEINNKAMHSVINEGQTPRVHLIFDIIPEDDAFLALMKAKKST